MSQHNKLQLASEMLLKAARDFETAASDIEYVNCILLAGAVVNICYPIIEERGGTSSFRALAEVATMLTERRAGTPMSQKERRKQAGRFLAFNQLTYNSLKHSGDPRRSDVRATDDIFFEADLNQEAEHMISAAIADFRSVPHSQSAIAGFDPAVLDLISSKWPG